MEIIWGWKTTAMMDVWTIEHLLSGLSVGSLVINYNRKIFKQHFSIEDPNLITKNFDVIGVLLLAFLWETVEHYLETGLNRETVSKTGHACTHLLFYLADGAYFCLSAFYVFA